MGATWRSLGKHTAPRCWAPGLPNARSTSSIWGLRSEGLAAAEAGAAASSRIKVMRKAEGVATPLRGEAAAAA